MVASGVARASEAAEKLAPDDFDDFSGDRKCPTVPSKCALTRFCAKFFLVIRAEFEKVSFSAASSACSVGFSRRLCYAEVVIPAAG